jgi:hypothetical protein
MRAALLLAIAACSFPEKHAGPGDGAIAIDAAPDAATPFGCAGMPFQTTAPAHLTISGTALDLGTGAIAAGVPVMGTTSSGTSAFSTTTDGSGDFSSTIATGGAALDAYVVTSPGTYAPSYFYPAHPFDADTSAPLPMLTPSELTEIGNPVGSGFAQLLLGDCIGNGLGGCTLDVTPTPQLVEYSKNGKPDMTATSTDATGYVLIYGLVAGGSTSFTATCPTGALRPASLAIAPDSTYFIELEP